MLGVTTAMHVAAVPAIVVAAVISIHLLTAILRI